MNFMKNYVMDLALIYSEEKPYFIEPNEYGANYGAGSALFHWIVDEKRLQDSDIIQFRYVDRE